MDIWLTASFRCPAEDSARWREILEDLADFKAGALLQERIEHFGPKAAAKIEAMMDEYDMSYWFIQEWFEEDGVFNFEIEGGGQTEEFAKDLAELLSMCRATDIQVKAEPEE